MQQKSHLKIFCLCTCRTFLEPWCLGFLLRLCHFLTFLPYLLFHHPLLSTWACAQRSAVSSSWPTPRTVARHAPLSMEFSRQEYWRGLPRPHPGDDQPGPSKWQLRVLNAKVKILWPNRNLLLSQVVILNYCPCDMWTVQYVVHTWENMQRK